MTTKFRKAHKENHQAGGLRPGAGAKVKTSDRRCNEVASRLLSGETLKSISLDKKMPSVWTLLRWRKKGMIPAKVSWND
jgi:hypothetical protein